MHLRQQQKQSIIVQPLAFGNYYLIIEVPVFRLVVQLNPVAVMDEFVYKTLCNYFHALELKGYMAYAQVKKLLVLGFYKDFAYYDYRALLSKEDYHLIERALDCLYGSSCLIPYPDYLKMGKLHLGDITELSQRVKDLENTTVLKPLPDPDNEDIPSDISIVYEDN